LTAHNLSQVYALMADHIESGIPGVPRIVPAHDIAQRIPLLARPVLALTAENEPLRKAHERCLKLLPNGQWHIFPGSHPLHNTARAAEFVNVITNFFAA
jgi:hypothetical protein